MWMSGGGGKGETLVYCLLLICIIYFDEMVPIAEFKERTQEMKGRREFKVFCWASKISFLFGDKQSKERKR